MGPLEGIKVIELVGIGPGPFCAMLLADMGAEVIRVARPEPEPARDPRMDVLARGRPSLALDLKHPDAVEIVLALVERADALIDPFRPDVLERLGLGPDVCFTRNPRLVLGRMTGWGQTGPLASRAGHDIGYLARSGVLSLIGRRDEQPVPPLNLVADFGGGALFLAVGVLAALHHARRTGQGQVVDAAMVDGAALLTAMVHQLRALGEWSAERGSNVLDTGAPFYDVYTTKDSRGISVGAMEPQFYGDLLAGLGLEDDELCAARDDRGRWAAIKRRIADVVATKTRDEWSQVFADRDACVEPVLTVDEAIEEPHLRERGTYREIFGVIQPAPAPRFGATPSRVRMPPARAGEHSREILASLGLSETEIDALIARGAVHAAPAGRSKSALPG